MRCLYQLAFSAKVSFGLGNRARDLALTKPFLFMTTTHELSTVCFRSAFHSHLLIISELRPLTSVGFACFSSPRFGSVRPRATIRPARFPLSSPFSLCDSLRAHFGQAHAPNRDPALCRTKIRFRAWTCQDLVLLVSPHQGLVLCALVPRFGPLGSPSLPLSTST